MILQPIFGPHIQATTVEAAFSGPRAPGEWETVKAAKALFPGHEWPRKTLWGYVNEADPYFPHVSIGWDNTPRYSTHTDSVVKGNTPEEFKKAPEDAKSFSNQHSKTPLITINSRNEWTETGYLQPDDRYGYGYLNAVKEVFGNS